MSARADFHEVHDVDTGLPAPGGRAPRLVLSRIRSGTGGIPAAKGFGIKYVHRGSEHYAFERSSFRVTAGHFLLVPEHMESEVSIRSHGNDATLGLCLSLPSDAVEADRIVDKPLLLSGDAFGIGRLLASTVDHLCLPGADPLDVAERFVARARGEIEKTAFEVGEALERLEMVKSTTRWAQYNCLERARSFLHEVDDRAVELPELSIVAGISRYQLARNFRLAYGLPPARYHRRLRLSRARRSLEQGGHSCHTAALRFGFGDGSAFSRAFRKEFGYPPRLIDGESPQQMVMG
jgi:AraC-like DNA-binding protein